MSNLTEQELSLLNQAADATENNTAIYAQREAMANLEAQGLVVGNPAVVDPNTNAIAYGVTEAGAVYVQNLRAAQSPAPAAPVATPAAPAPVEATQPSPAAPSGVETPNGTIIQSGFKMPEKPKRGPSVSRNYNFEKLELGQAEFVPATEKRPDPKKSLASTISSANKRFKDFNPPRHFKTVRANKGEQFGDAVAPSDGCYIVRVEPPVEDKPLNG